MTKNLNLMATPKPTTKQSQSYEDDYEIIAYCTSDGLNDSDCDCINNKTKKKTEKSILLPFECVSKECQDPNNYKTYLIQRYQDYCTYTTCEIKVEGFEAQGETSIVIKNDCESTENTIDKIFIEAPLRKAYVPQIQSLNYIIPIIASCLLLLI